jgi:hypothetical protein
MRYSMKRSIQPLHACGLALVLAASSSAWAQRPPAPTIPVDDHYILALSTADQFLHAWATRDADAGRATLTPAVITRYSADEIATLFQGVSSPHHESFEIGPGHALSPAKYAFDVIQYEYLTNMNFHGSRRRPARLVVVQVEPDTWLVDEFPDS